MGPSKLPSHSPADKVAVNASVTSCFDFSHPALFMCQRKGTGALTGAKALMPQYMAASDEAQVLMQQSSTHRDAGKC
eukprot:653354-Pelagomonas_calceolata.AAC.2